MTVFDNPHLAWIIKERKRLFLGIKTKQLSITKDILEKIILLATMSIEECNIDTAFKIAWVRFLRLGENLTFLLPKMTNTLFTD